MMRIPAQLQRDLDAVADYFGLSPAERDACTLSARSHPARAATCYRAIASSLPGARSGSGLTTCYVRMPVQYTYAGYSLSPERVE